MGLGSAKTGRALNMSGLLQNDERSEPDSANQTARKPGIPAGAREAVTRQSDLDGSAIRP